MVGGTSDGEMASEVSDNWGKSKTVSAISCLGWCLEVLVANGPSSS